VYQSRLLRLCEGFAASMKPIDQLSEAQWLELVHEAATMSDAPPSWVRSALQLWHAQGPARAALSEPAEPSLRRWVAALSFDSWAAPALAGGMRILASDVRHLLFTAGGRDIDLRVEPLAEAYAVSGQVLGPNGEGRVVLAEIAPGLAARATHVAALDELGEFRVEAVGQGSYLVTLRLHADEIVLPPIDIGPPRGAGPK
jgi:hypothetical protein